RHDRTMADWDEMYAHEVGAEMTETRQQLESRWEQRHGTARAVHAQIETLDFVAKTIRELATSNNADLSRSTLVAGGGGAPFIFGTVSTLSGIGRSGSYDSWTEPRLIEDYSVISAIGAALAVTCVSLSRNVAQPSGGDIAELISEVESRLAAQGAERVATDYEYDPRRQVLTVTGRGSRPYEKDAKVCTIEEQQDIVKDVLKADPALQWQDNGTSLWITSTGESVRRPSAGLACATSRFGRVLWLGKVAAFEPAAPGRISEALEAVVARHTQHTDGGAVLPNLGLLTGGRYIPLDQLGSAELIAEVLRWEKLPADAQGCFVVGKG
nr:hypothetical protein [bacterium]